MVEGVRVFIDIVTTTYEHEYELWISVENQMRFNDLLHGESSLVLFPELLREEELRKH